MKPTEEDYNHIKTKIIDYLSRQEFSKRKLLQKVTDLKRRYPHTVRYQNYSTSNVQKVIDELESRGVIDETRYAENTLRFLKDKKDGIMKMKEKMYRRLIDPEIIEKVLREFEFNGRKQHYEKIRTLVSRKRQELIRKKFHVSVIRQKVYAFLAQKGYLPDDIRNILNEDNTLL